MEQELLIKKIKTKDIIIVILAVIIFLIIFSAFSPRNITEGYSVDEETGIYINIISPVGWYNKDTDVNIEIEDTKNALIKNIKAKIGEKGTWQDITDEMFITISENVTVYIKVLDRKGRETEKSRYIGVFDREKPTLSASVSGNMLRVEASDTISGVDAIFINGYIFKELINDVLDIELSSFSDDENLKIQVRDKAGNLSPMYTTKNPLFEELKKEEEAKKKAEEEEEKKAKAKEESKTEEETKKASTTSQPTGNASTTTPTAGAGETTTAGEGSGDGKNDTGSEANKDNPLFGTFEDTNKQFMSIVTKDGKMFYMIIDHDREEENVYLLTEVTNSDLESFTEEETIEGNENLDEEIPEDELIDGGKLSKELDLIVDPSENSDEKTVNNTSDEDITSKEDDKSKDIEEKEEVKKKNPIPGYIVLAIIIAVLGFAGYMFFVFLPRKKESEYFEDDSEEETKKEDFENSSNFEENEDNLESEVGNMNALQVEEFESEEQYYEEE